jgi:AraC family transcriptional regulator
MRAIGPRSAGGDVTASGSQAFNEDPRGSEERRRAQSQRHGRTGFLEKPGAPPTGDNTNQRWMIDMGVSSAIRDHGIHKRSSRRLSALSEHSPVTLASRLLDTALRIWDEDQAQAKSQIEIAAAMLHSDIDEWPAQEAPAGRVGHGLAPWQVRKVQEFIDASLDSKIRLRDCACQTRLSASHFSRAFKATFGTTVLDYIHRCRVERAQQLMLTSERPMSQIALSCGFADQAHYCRVFRAVVGLSPNAWRRQYKREGAAHQARLEEHVVDPPLSGPGWSPVSTTERV